jgi:hypothetical protein
MRLHPRISRYAAPRLPRLQEQEVPLSATALPLAWEQFSHRFPGSLVLLGAPSLKGFKSRSYRHSLFRPKPTVYPKFGSEKLLVCGRPYLDLEVDCRESDSEPTAQRALTVRLLV